MIKIGVSGARGRMGQRIIALAKEDSLLSVVFGLEVKGHADIGKTIDGVPITDTIGDCDCLIDFSTPQATIANLAVKKPIVIGTTGLSASELDKISEAAEPVGK